LTVATTTSRGKELTRRREAVAAAERRVRELEAERRSAARKLAGARAEYGDYWHAVEAGERERDQHVEDQLAAAVQSLGSVVTMRPVLNQGRVSEFEAIDERVEAQLEAARTKLEDRRRELADYLAEHRVALVAERLPVARRIGARHAEAVAELAAADAAWFAEVRALIHDYGVSAADIPPRPFNPDGLGQAFADFDAAADTDLIPSPKWITES
jgi:chromosome segregation ATPase